MQFKSNSNPIESNQIKSNHNQPEQTTQPTRLKLKNEIGKNNSRGKGKGKKGKKDFQKIYKACLALPVYVIALASLHEHEHEHGNQANQTKQNQTKQTKRNEQPGAGD